ncbi:hypothetical protein ACQX0N_09325 [Clostridium tepidum]
MVFKKCAVCYNVVVKNTFLINKEDKYKQRIIDMAYEYKKIREEILKVHNDEKYVTDILVEYLYSNKKENKKVTLWECFGDVILENLINNLTKGFKKEAMECEKCGILIEKKSNKTKYCDECKKEILQKQKNKWKREKWNKSNKEEK